MYAYTTGDSIARDPRNTVLKVTAPYYALQSQKAVGISAFFFGFALQYFSESVS